jgi:phosphatidylethanolamine-binding protein (PEBP) family uncharacterized protein
MKSIFVSFVTACSALVVAASAYAQKFELSSTDILPNSLITSEFVFNGFGCTGLNMSPQLSWKNADTTQLARGAGTTSGSALPMGARQIATDFGTPGWGGPCPPEGDKPHHYNFTVYALKVAKLELPANATASLTGFMVNANALAQATLTGRYGR